MLVRVFLVTNDKNLTDVGVGGKGSGGGCNWEGGSGGSADLSTFLARAAPLCAAAERSDEQTEPLLEKTVRYWGVPSSEGSSL